MKVFRKLWYVPFRIALNERPDRENEKKRKNMLKSMFCPLMRWWTMAELNDVVYRCKNSLKILHSVEIVHKSRHWI